MCSDDSQGPGVLWAKHFRGEAHQNSFNVYRGGFDQKGILSFLFGSSLPPLVSESILIWCKPSSGRFQAVSHSLICSCHFHLRNLELLLSMLLTYQALLKSVLFFST